MGRELVVLRKKYVAKPPAMMPGAPNITPAIAVTTGSGWAAVQVRTILQGRESMLAARGLLANEGPWLGAEPSLPEP